MKVIGVRVGCEGVQVGYEKVAVVIVLHLDIVAQRTIVISQMQVSGGTDPA
jgi:hypothetical protein